jgi:hypothetical protein
LVWTWRGLTDLMVAIGVSGVEDRSEPRLAREFGLGGTRWHGVGLILDDVRWHKIWIKWVKYCSNPHNKTDTCQVRT